MSTLPKTNKTVKTQSVKTYWKTFLKKTNKKVDRIILLSILESFINRHSPELIRPKKYKKTIEEQKKYEWNIIRRFIDYYLELR